MTLLKDEVKYVYQEKQLGTAHAILCAKDYFNDKEELVNRLKEFNAFYVIGGNTFALRQAMYLSGFDEYLKTYYEPHNGRREIFKY